MSAVLMDNIAWESDEGFETESDEAYGDGEDSEDFGDDFGEASRGRRGRRGRPDYRLNQGVRGMALRNPDGQVRNVPFPKKLATVAETNKGLASQASARKALAERVDRLEGKYKNSSKHDAAIIGTTTLAIGLPLTVVGLAQAHNNPATGRSAFRTWAHYRKTDAVAVSSATQLVTTGAKYLLDHRYHHSRVGVVADIFATLQLAAYAVGHFPQAAASAASSAVAAIATAPREFASLNAARNALNTLSVGQQVLTRDGKRFTVITIAGGGTALQLIT